MIDENSNYVSGGFLGREYSLNRDVPKLREIFRWSCNYERNDEQANPFMYYQLLITFFNDFQQYYG